MSTHLLSLTTAAMVVTLARRVSLIFMDLCIVSTGALCHDDDDEDVRNGDYFVLL